jgi:hypothetical protein
VQLPQERQSRRGLTIEEQEHHREVLLFHAAIERFVIFHRLPWADALFADQQDEGCRFSDLPSEFRNPQAPSSQFFRREEYVCAGILPLERRLEARHEPHILRVVAKEPASHVRAASTWVGSFAD